MQINDKYEDILSEYESDTLNLNDVINTDSIQDELGNFITYLNKTRINNYKALFLTVENNEEYSNQINSAIKRHTLLSEELVKIHKKDLKLSENATLFLLSKIKEKHNMSLNFTNTPKENFKANIQEFDIEETIGDIKYAIEDYASELEDINGKELVKELTIEVKNEPYTDTDERPETFNHVTNTIGYRTTTFTVENITFDISFSGKESDKLIIEDMEGIIESISDNMPYKLDDKTYDFNIRPKEKNKQKKRMKLS
jgi:hypothetical protein